MPTVGGPAIRRQARKRRAGQASVSPAPACDRAPFLLLQTGRCAAAVRQDTCRTVPGLTEVKRDFRARCRIGGPAALGALGRQAGTDIRHSAGEVLARASNWERRRLYCGRISGMDDEERARDAAFNPAPGRSR